MPPRRTPKNCVYIENGYPCRRKGQGNPPICEYHQDNDNDDDEVEFESNFGSNDVMEEALENILTHPSVQNFFDQISQSVHKATRILEQATSGQLGKTIKENRRQAKQQTTSTRNSQQKTPPVPPRAPKEDPRVVLGFGPNIKLTPEMVKERRKKLAQLFHPDQAGSTEAMTRVNAAADALLKTL